MQHIEHGKKATKIAVVTLYLSSVVVNWLIELAKETTNVSVLAFMPVGVNVKHV